MNAIYQPLNDSELSPSGEFSTRRVLLVQDAMNRPIIKLGNNVGEQKSDFSNIAGFQKMLTVLPDNLAVLADEKHYSAFVTTQNSDGIFNRITEIQANMLVLVVRKLTPSILKQLCDINDLAPVTVVVFVSEHDDRALAKLREAGVDSYNVDPQGTTYKTKNLEVILDVAEQHFTDEARLINQLNQTKKKLADRKLVARAKGILMQQHGLSEEQAYTQMRRSAMNQGCTMADLAVRLIKVFDSFKEA